jgi:hypothetical protein
MNFSGQFFGCSESNRREKLNLMIDAIADHKLIGFSAAVPHHNFYPLFGKNRPHWKRSAYYLAFYMIVARLLAYYTNLGINDKIDFVFDYQPGSDQMRAAQEGWDLFVKHLPPEAMLLVNKHPPSFLDDEQIVALQAADLAAGWIRKFQEAAMLGKKPPEEPWDKRGHLIPMHYYVLNEELAEKLAEFMFGVKQFLIRYRWGYGYDPSPAVSEIQFF